jgi:uncharacterized membrane protein
MVMYEGVPAAVQKPMDKPVHGWRYWPLEQVFLGVGFFFGVLFLLTTPPFQVADESRHFVRAYTYAEAILHRLGWIAPAEALPESVVRAIEQTEYLRFDPMSKTTVGHTLSLLAPQLQPHERATYGETAPYALISYLPQVVPLMVCRLRHINAVATLYIARLCALLFWLGITYVAIRKLPVAKHLLFFIALLPMTLFQAASLSADCMTLAVSFLLIACYLQLAHRAGPVDGRSMLLISGLGALLTATKLVYLPLIGLHFLIRPARFGSRRTYLMSFALTAVACLGSLVLLYSPVLAPLLGFAPPLPETTGSATTTPYPQVNFLLADPFNGLRMMGATFSRFGRAYLNGFVGILGWSSASLPSYLYILTAVMIGLVASTTDSLWLIRTQHKLLFAGIILLITTIIFVAISTDTLHNGQPTLLLSGVQGRYFTPFAPLVGLLAVNRSWLAVRYRQYVQTATLPFVVFLLLNAVYVLLNHYYVL